MKYYTYLAAFALCFTFACNNKKITEKESGKTINENEVSITAAQAKNINLQIGQVTFGQISEMLKLQGRIDVPPQNLVSVSIPLGGYLKATKMLPGTQVRKGQVIAVMEDPQYIQLQQDYLSVKNKLKYAEKEMNRQKDLNASRANSEKTLQFAETEYYNLKVEHSALVEKLKLINIITSQLNEGKISRTIPIYSPINGFVSKVNVNIGKYVTPSDVIFELINPNDIHLNLTVFEKDQHKIHIGQRVLAFTNVSPDIKYETQVILVNQNITADGSVEVHCHFEKYDRRLVPGMYMNAELQSNNQTVQLLPENAVVNFENKDFVFEQLSENRFKMIEVSAGEITMGRIAIHTNLKGKQLVVKGAYSLLMKLKNTSDEE